MITDCLGGGVVGGVSCDVMLGVGLTIEIQIFSLCVCV